MLSACQNYNVSSVPNYRVNLSIDTRIWADYSPNLTASYITIDKDGYHFPNGQYKALTAGDYFGYAGVVLVYTLDGKLAAFDLCCPVCLDPQEPLEMDSYARAICPHCGEEFDTTLGYGFPTKGKTRESLKRYNVTCPNQIITIYN